MASLVDDFLISIGLDAKDFAKGIDKVRTDLGEVAGQASGAFEEVGDSSVKAGSVSALSFDKSAKRIDNLGEVASEAAESIESAFSGLSPVFEAVRSRVGALAATFALVAGGVETFTNYIEKSDALGNLSTQLGIDVKELDAFGKAAEAAGGSAEAMFSTMQSYYEQTGRPAEEVFQLAKKVEGMSRGAAQRYLQAQGVATDAIPIFLQGQKAMDDLMAKYRKTAFTAQDAKNARAFKVAWMDFKTASQSVGNTLVRMVLPVVTKLVDGLSELVGIIGENSRAFVLLGIGFGAVFAAKNIESIKQAVTAMRALGSAVKMAALPVTAIVVGIGSLALAIDDLIGFAQGADSMFERMLRSFGMGSEQIEDLRENIQSVGKAFGWLWDIVKPLLSGALSVVFKVLAGAVLGVVVVLEGLILGFQTLWNSTKKVGRAISDAFSEGIDFVEKLISTVVSFGSNLADVFSGIPDAIVSGLESAWDAVVEWFGQWADLIKEKIGEPVKSLFKGIGSFFGFGDDDKKTEDQQAAASVRERETVAVQQAAYRASSPTVTTNASMNVVNNISTRDNPQAIGRAVEGSVTGGFNRQAALIGQAMSGTNLK